MDSASPKKARPRPKARVRTAPAVLPVSQTPAGTGDQNIASGGLAGMTAGEGVMSPPRKVEGGDMFAHRQRQVQAMKQQRAERQAKAHPSGASASTETPSLNTGLEESEEDYSSDEEGGGKRKRRRKRSVPMPRKGSTPAWTRVGAVEMAAKVGGIGKGKGREMDGMGGSDDSDEDFKIQDGLTPKPGPGQGPIPTRHRIVITPPPQPDPALAAMRAYANSQHHYTLSSTISFDDDEGFPPPATPPEVVRDPAILAAIERAKVEALERQRLRKERVGSGSGVAGAGGGGGEEGEDIGTKVDISVFMQLDPEEEGRMSMIAVNALKKKRIFRMGTNQAVEGILEGLAEKIKTPMASLVLVHNKIRIYSASTTLEQLRINCDDEMQAYHTATWEKLSKQSEAAQRERLEQLTREADQAAAEVVRVDVDDGDHDDDGILILDTASAGPSKYVQPPARATRRAAPTPAEDTPAAADENILQLNLRGQQGDVAIKVRPTTVISKLVAHYVTKMGLNGAAANIRLEWDGEVLNPTAKVGDLDVEDGDMLSVLEAH